MKNINTKSGNRSKQTQRRTGFYGWISRISRTNAIIVAAFVLLFGGVGTYHVENSHADAPTGYCVYYKLYYYRSGFYGSQCVKDVQFALQRLGYFSGNIDGIYGPQTEAAVLYFGNVARIPHGNSGQVGVRTWNALCVRSYRYPSVANNMGCNKPDQYWGTL